MMVQQPPLYPRVSAFEEMPAPVNWIVLAILIAAASAGLWATWG
jgi:hypothetical protein